MAFAGTIARFSVTAVICLTAIGMSPSSAGAVTLMAADKQERVAAFYSESDKTAWNTVLRGEILSIGTREDAQKNELFRAAQDRTKATVRLYNSEGLKKGDELFVINPRNLIVGRIQVEIVFPTATFGDMLIGYGNFKAIRIGFRVVQRVENEYAKNAFIYTARGNYFRDSGDPGKAIEYYKRAIQYDRGNPEAHLGLGQVYLKDRMYPFAHKEFFEAYRQIDRLYDREDKYLVLKGLVEVRYIQVYEQILDNRLKKEYISEGINYARKALEIFPNSRDVNLYLGMFYFNNPEPDDVKAKDQFLKVVEIDPLNTDAYIALAELYQKHRNGKKAFLYARKALHIDPNNMRARQILNLTE